MLTNLKTAVAASLICVLAGCTTLKPLPPRSSPQELRTQLKAGDEVRVTTRTGERLRFKVTEVGDADVVGSRKSAQVRLAYDEIAAVDVREVSAGKTIGLTVLTIVGAFCGLVTVAVLSW